MMEVGLKKEIYNFYKEIAGGKTVKEETAEMIVPNSRPDILQVVSTSASVFLRSKEISGGRICITGDCETVVLYIPEDHSGVQKIVVEVPFTAEIPCADAGENPEIEAMVRLVNADCRVLNPRKILVRANILAEAHCFRREKLTLPENSEKNCAEILLKTSKATVFSEIREKTFALSDEFSLPASKPPIGEILKKAVSIDAEDVKIIGSKLIFKGTARVNILYKALETEEIEQADFTVGFTQIVEMENVAEEDKIEVFPEITGTYFNDESIDRRSISMELHAVCQIRTSKQIEIPYIADAYSTKYELDQKKLDLKIDKIELTEPEILQIRETLTTSEPVRSVLDTVVMLGDVFAGENGECRTVAKISVLYLNETGNVCACDKSCEIRIPACEQCDIKHMLSGNVYSAIVGEGVEVRFSVCIEKRKCIQSTLSAITELSYDEEKVKDTSALPSVVLTKAKKNQCLWSLAKRYSSSRELIKRSNGLEDGDCAVKDGFLIIPKMR